MNQWFKKKIIYQIYPMSFKDTTGNGIGDINGIIEKLDYLNELGVNILWITPIYNSPKNDNGYDVADYYTIDSQYGTMQDFETLLLEAKKRNIEIMMDIVANHTSTEHAWFKKAILGDIKYQNYYVFRDAEFVKEHPLTSIFGGKAWSYIETLNLYYLHNFDSTQADLDWTNKEVRDEIYKILNFWLEKGVKGFRFDVIDMISKNWEKNEMSNGENLHTYIEEMNSKTFGKKEIITVGETWSADLEHMKKYSNIEGKEFSMVFNFEHTMYNHDKWTTKIDSRELKYIFERNQTGLFEKGWNSLFLNNHDLPRLISRYGNDSPQWREKTGKQWAIILHFMQGTPYIFQGEEIGMTNRNWKKEELKDIESINFYNSRIKTIDKLEVEKMLKEISRDNARTPIQWNNSLNAGFSTGKPWSIVNENYKEINVEKSLNNKKSLFYTYKKLIDYRKNIDVITNGTFELILKDNKNIFAYRRKNSKEEILVISNLTSQILKIKDMEKEIRGEVLISNYEQNNIKELQPYETIAFYNIF